MNSLTSENKSWTKAVASGQRVQFLTAPLDDALSAGFTFSFLIAGRAQVTPHMPQWKHIIHHKELWPQATLVRKGAPENTGKQARKRTEETSRQTQQNSWTPTTPASPITEESPGQKGTSMGKSGTWFSPMTMAWCLIWNHQLTDCINDPSKLWVSLGTYDSQKLKIQGYLVTNHILHTRYWLHLIFTSSKQNQCHHIF